MRLVARFPDMHQASAAIDSLRKIGFDRKDMIVSDLKNTQKYNTSEEAAEEITFLKTERDGLGEFEAFGDGIKNLRGTEGIVVAVKSPRNESDRLLSIMEQSGAVEIVQD